MTQTRTVNRPRGPRRRQITLPRIAAFPLLALLTGCTTVYADMAPAHPGFVYVAGMHNGTAAMWLCPSAPTGQACQEVDVEGTP